jgi:ubiquitin-conjugating enzyme E2 R
MAAQTLQRQLKELHKNPIPGFRVALLDDDIFTWDIGIIGPPASIYEGGYFRATMKFPADYPFNPPSFHFNRPFYHPNVYPGDNKLCISILHPPGDDPTSGETAAERWNPTQSVESILLSIVSLLSDPNCSSPANVDAGVMFRKDPSEYKKIIRQQVETSKQDVPEGFTLPTSMDEFIIRPPTREDSDYEDEDFWFDEESEGDYDDQSDEGNFDEDD